MLIMIYFCVLVRDRMENAITLLSLFFVALLVRILMITVKYAVCSEKAMLEFRSTKLDKKSSKKLSVYYWWE